MSIHARITREPIDAGRLLSLVEAPGAGAAVLFVGLVRDTNEGRPVSGLRYEAYAPMAEKMLREVASEIIARGRIADAEARVAVEHRVGELDVGDVAVVVAVSTGHRAEAFEACRTMIDEIKVRVPIWKRERYADGNETWLEGESPAVADAGGRASADA